MSPNYYKLPDVSFWQDDPTTLGGIDFTLMRKQTRGVFIRAGQGTNEDNEFKISWKNAKAAGMLRGSYWFYDSRVNPKRQAEKWVSVLGDDIGEMELCADFEDRYGGDFRGWRNWYDFMERVKELIPGVKMIVYTGYYYFQEFAAGVKYFAQYPLWIAWYNPTPPLVPPIWKDWTYHQFTDDAPGTLYGVESREIDLNYFNGTESDFTARYGVGETPTPKGTLTVKYGDSLVEYKEQ